MTINWDVRFRLDRYLVQIVLYLHARLSIPKICIVNTDE